MKVLASENSTNVVLGKPMPPRPDYNPRNSMSLYTVNLSLINIPPINNLPPINLSPTSLHAVNLLQRPMWFAIMRSLSCDGNQPTVRGMKRSPCHWSASPSAPLNHNYSSTLSARLFPPFITTIGFAPVTGPAFPNILS